MTGMCIPRFAVLLAIAAAGTAVPIRAQSKPQADPVRLTPAAVQTGSPVLISVIAPRNATLEGDWLGRKLQFFRGRNGQAWFALAGADVEAPPGPSTLRIVARPRKGAPVDLGRSVEILPATYRTSELTVAPEYVEPGPEAARQIAADSALKDKVFALSAPRPLWSGSFRAPARAPLDDNFGARRTYNGKLNSIHKGTDFRARPGTPVRAANSGLVVLARPLYFEGNCVIIDHGLGLFTISMHLSRIGVHEGQRLARGQRIGLSGSTGRATGPHLHWSVRWQGAYLDPAQLLRLNLASVR